MIRISQFPGIFPLLIIRLAYMQLNVIIKNYIKKLTYKEVSMGTYSPNIMANSFISCAQYNGKSEVIIYDKQHITWEKLKPRIFKIAQALVELGVKKDDKVSFMFHNTPEFLEINYGIQVAGAIPSPMNYRFIPRRLNSRSITLMLKS